MDYKAIKEKLISALIWMFILGLLILIVAFILDIKVLQNIGLYIFIVPITCVGILFTLGIAACISEFLADLFPKVAGKKIGYRMFIIIGLLIVALMIIFSDTSQELPEIRGYWRH